MIRKIFRQTDYDKRMKIICQTLSLKLVFLYLSSFNSSDLSSDSDSGDGGNDFVGRLNVNDRTNVPREWVGYAIMHSKAHIWTFPILLY